MSEITHTNMNASTDIVTSLKNQFCAEYKNNKVAIDLLKKMRITHGCALYDDFIDYENIKKKGIQNTTDEEWIKLSTNASLLYVIHSHIRRCERLLYNYNNKTNITPLFSTSESEIQITTPSEILSENQETKTPTEKNETSFQNALNTLKEHRKSIGTITNVSRNPKQEKLENTTLGNMSTETGTITNVSRNPKQEKLENTFKNIYTTLGNMKTGIGSKIKKSINNTDELSINANSEGTKIDISQLFNEIETPKSLSTGGSNTIYDLVPHIADDLAPKQGSGAISPHIADDTINTSDYINNLTSSEAARLASEYEKNKITEKSPLNSNLNSKQTNQNGGIFFDINKPTLINYYADWCGFSQKFLPVWNEFKSKGNKYPELQITELNIGMDKQLNKIALKAGVNGYPTIVLFYKGKTYPQVASNLSVDDINRFIGSIIEK